MRWITHLTIASDLRTRGGSTGSSMRKLWEHALYMAKLSWDFSSSRPARSVKPSKLKLLLCTRLDLETPKPLKLNTMGEEREQNVVTFDVCWVQSALLINKFNNQREMHSYPAMGKLASTSAMATNTAIVSKPHCSLYVWYKGSTAVTSWLQLRDIWLHPIQLPVEPPPLVGTLPLTTNHIQPVLNHNQGHS